MHWGWRLLVVAVAAVAGVLLRPYLLSDWGPYAFIFAFWLVISVVAAWRGGGKPHAPVFGLICGSSFALMLIITALTNVYGGAVAIAVLLYLAVKTKFLERNLGSV